MRNRFLALLAIAAWATVVSSARAVDRHFISNNGSWSNAANWSPAGVPQPADNAILDFFNGAGGRATINSDVLGVTSVSISNSGTLVFANGGTLIVGSGGMAVGTNNSPGLLTMFNVNPLIDYHASLTLTGSLRIGEFSGNGTIRQNVGTIALATFLDIGSIADTTSMFGSTGTYNFGGGGFRGKFVDVGSDSRSNGSLNVSGGSFSAEVMSVSGSNGGNGTVNQSGGTITVTNFMQLVSGQTTGHGVYNLSGGTLDVSQIVLGGGAGTDEFNYNGGTILVDGMDFRKNSRMTLAAGGALVLRLDGGLRMGAFSPTEKGYLDLNDNRMTTFGSQDNLVEVQTDLRSGYNGGAWNGQGIMSTAAAASPAHSRALGYNNVLNELTVQYTYYGDTDLNGVINFDDYSRTDNGFNTGGSDWLHGDFNYNGVVNFDDYALIDLAFNTQSNTLARALAYLNGGARGDADMNSPALRIVHVHFAQFGQAYASSFLNAVPEPRAAIYLLGAMLVFCSAKRTRASSARQVP